MIKSITIIFFKLFVSILLLSSISACSLFKSEDKDELTLTINIKIPSTELPFYLVIRHPDKMENFVSANYYSVMQRMFDPDVQYFLVNQAKQKIKLTLNKSNVDNAIYFIPRQQSEKNWKFYFNAKK